MSAPEAARQPDWMRSEERGNRFWLSVMVLLSRLFGRPLSRLVLYGIAAYFVLFAGEARRASRAYLARALPRPPGWRDVYRHVLTFASTIHDRVYLLRDEFHRFDIQLVGAEPLHRDYDNGQGLLLFGAHLGSFEALRSVSRHRPGQKVSMAMYPENARRINAALSAINPDALADIIPLGTLDAMLNVHHKLKNGEMVGLLADRASGPDHYLARPFLGGVAHFPSGPFRMAAMLKQPVYFMTGLYQGGKRYELYFELLEDFSAPNDDREAAVGALLDRYVAALERQCRAAPYNWFNFFDFWKAHPDA